MKSVIQMHQFLVLTTVALLSQGVHAGDGNSSGNSSGGGGYCDISQANFAKLYEKSTGKRDPIQGDPREHWKSSISLKDHYTHYVKPSSGCQIPTGELVDLQGRDPTGISSVIAESCRLAGGLPDLMESRIAPSPDCKSVWTWTFRQTAENQLKYQNPPQFCNTAQEKGYAIDPTTGAFCIRTPYFPTRELAVTKFAQDQNAAYPDDDTLVVSHYSDIGVSMFQILSSESPEGKVYSTFGEQPIMGHFNSQTGVFTIAQPTGEWYPGTTGGSTLKAK